MLRIELYRLLPCMPRIHSCGWLVEHHSRAQLLEQVQRHLPETAVQPEIAWQRSTAHALPLCRGPARRGQSSSGSCDTRIIAIRSRFVCVCEPDLILNTILTGILRTESMAGTDNEPASSGRWSAPEFCADHLSQQGLVERS